MKTLVKHGANIRATGKDGSTPLYICAQEGHTAIVKYLIKASADVNAKWNSGYTPLYIAAQKGHKEIVALLIEHGADIEAASDVGSTPLYIAAQKGNTEVVEYLIRRKSNVEAKFKVKISSFNSTRTILTLITQGCYTPLYIACQNGWLPIVKLLLNAGANIEGKNSNLMSILIKKYEF